MTCWATLVALKHLSGLGTYPGPIDFVSAEGVAEEGGGGTSMASPRRGRCLLLLAAQVITDCCSQGPASSDLGAAESFVTFCSLATAA